MMTRRLCNTRQDVIFSLQTSFIYINNFSFYSLLIIINCNHSTGTKLASCFIFFSFFFDKSQISFLRSIRSYSTINYIFSRKPSIMSIVLRNSLEIFDQITVIYIGHWAMKIMSFWLLKKIHINTWTKN